MNAQIVSKILSFLKPDIIATVWEGKPERESDMAITDYLFVRYDDAEKFRPTKDEILEADIELVNAHWSKIEKANKNTNGVSK